MSKSGPALALIKKADRAFAGSRRQVHVAENRREVLVTSRMGLRSWRDTGITWLALAGVDVAEIQRRAGHDEITTTISYVKAAEDVNGSIGEPFRPLPACLVSSDPIEVDRDRN